MTRALIDGDIVCFRAAAAAENEDEGIARYYADNLLDEIIAGTKADSYNFYLTGKGNFRYSVYPEYKAQRIDTPRPRHLAFLREYFTNQGAIVSEGCEADDLLGAEQCSSQDETVIVSLDKDLLTIPGYHYSWEIRGKSKGKSWVKEAKWTNQTTFEANYWFYTQCIIGDVADNIKGIPGVGKVGAAKILDGLVDEQEMFDAVRTAYDNDDEFLMNARCIYIWRKPNDDFREHFKRLSGEGNATEQCEE